MNGQIATTTPPLLNFSAYGKWLYKDVAYNCYGRLRAQLRIARLGHMGQIKKKATNPIILKRSTLRTSLTKRNPANDNIKMTENGNFIAYPFVLHVIFCCAWIINFF